MSPKQNPQPLSTWALEELQNPTYLRAPLAGGMGRGRPRGEPDHVQRSDQIRSASARRKFHMANSALARAASGHGEGASSVFQGTQGQRLGRAGLTVSSADAP